jgi:hypothetical protein
MVGIHAAGEEFPISLWMRKVASTTAGEGNRYVAVVEPVMRVELRAALDGDGAVIWGDPIFLQRFGWWPF